MRVVRMPPLSRLAKIRTRAFQPGLRHSGDVKELVKRGKVALPLSQLDDALRDGSADAWNDSKLGGVRLVDVDAFAGGRPGGVPSSVPTAGMRLREFALQRDVDLVPILRALREIHGGRVRRGAQPTGQRDRLSVAIARTQAIQARPFHGARDVNDQHVLTRIQMPAAAMLRLHAVVIPSKRGL